MTRCLLLGFWLAGPLLAQQDVAKPKDAFELPAAGLALAFAPDGSFLAVGDAAGAITLWKLPERQNGNPINAHTEAIHGLRFSPDGKTLLSASADKTVKIWEVETAKLKLRLTGHTEAVHAAAFSPKGTVIASGGDDRKVRLANSADGKLVKELSDSGVAIRMLDFAPDGRTLAVVGTPAMGEAKVLLYNVVSSTLKSGLTGHTGSVDCLAWSGDSQLLATGGADKTVRFWHGQSGKSMKVLTGHGGPVTAVAFTPNGKSLVSASGDRTLRVWDVASGKAAAVLWGHLAPIVSVAIAPDGVQAASADGSQLRFWDLARARSQPNAYAKIGDEQANLVAHWGHAAWSLAAGGKTLASHGSDHKVRLWDLAQRKLLREFDTEAQPTAMPLAVSPDGKLLATLKPAGIEIRDSAGKVLRTLQRKSPPPADAPPAVRGFFFNAKGDLLIAAVDTHIVGWDPRDGAERFSRTPESPVTALRPLPDGKSWASGGQNGEVLIWQMGQPKPFQALHGHRAAITALAISPDGKMLASAAAGEPIRTWELESGKNLRLLEGGAGPLLFWDETTLLTGGQGGPIQVWDLADGRVRRTLRGHGAEFHALLRAGDTLVSAGDDGTIKLWELKKPAAPEPPETR